MRMFRSFYLLIPLFFLFSGITVAQDCVLEFIYSTGPVFDPGEEFEVRIYFKDEDPVTGLLDYALANWDDDGVPGPDIEVEGGTYSVEVLGSGNDINSSYGILVTVVVGTGNALNISLNATGLNTGCEATGDLVFIVLPVEFTKLEAELKSIGVEIEWQTAREINNESFTIQRSFDATSFEDLNIVKGAGNSNDYEDYKYVDDEFLLNPAYHAIRPNEIYYRLKQTDYNGLISFSEIMVVQTDKVKTLKKGILSVVSESNGLTIQLSEGLIHKHSLQVFDLQGNLIIDQIAPSFTERLNLKSNRLVRHNGILILQLSGPELDETMKFYK